MLLLNLPALERSEELQRVRLGEDLLEQHVQLRLCRISRSHVERSIDLFLDQRWLPGSMSNFRSGRRYPSGVGFSSGCTQTLL